MFHAKKEPMMGKADKIGQITPKQEAFVDAYLDCDFIIQAAHEVEVSERTARRWLADPAIQSAIAQLRQERRDIRESRLALCIDRAISIVADTLLYASDKSESERCRVYVSRETEFKYVSLMFRYASDRREIDTLKQRIAQLEAAQEPQAVEGTVSRLPVRRISK
jgi:hypothetical protein